MRRLSRWTRERTRAFVDAGVDSAVGADERVRIQRANALVFIGGLIAAGFAIKSFAVGDVVAGGIAVALMLFFVGIRFWALRMPTGRSNPVVHFCLLGLTAALTYLAWESGLAIGTVPLYALVVLAAALVIGPRAAVGWTVITIGAIAFVTFSGPALTMASAAIPTKAELFVSRAIFQLAILGMAVAARFATDRWAGEYRAAYQAEAEAHERTRRITRDLESAHHKAIEAEVRAERANDAKSEFLSRVSHELRTPLNAITGFGQLLSRADDLDERYTDWAERINDAAQHLLALIEEVLDISRIETGSLDLHIEDVSVYEVLAAVMDLVQPLTAEKNVAVLWSETESAVCVSADSKRLSEVVLNLVANAIKYNVEQGSVSISVTADTDRVRISISDTGIGIPDEKLGRLFVPFDRLGAERSDVTGTGIGLSIAKHLVDAMGGRLDVASAFHQGSSFTVELPRSAATHADVTHARDRLEGGRSRDVRIATETRHVVYVEDDPTNARLITATLADREDIHIDVFPQGRIALEHCRRQPPDIVLLDMYLPDAHGDAIVAELRAHEATAAIPIIAITADATAKMRELLEDLDLIAYFTKPVDLAELIDRIDDVLDDSSESPAVKPASDASGV